MRGDGVYRIGRDSAESAQTPQPKRQVAAALGLALPHEVRSIRSIGVEEELLLVDSENLCTVPIAADVIREAGGDQPDQTTTLELEVKREQVEVVSAPLTTFEELSTTILLGRQAADRAAQKFGARAVALATSAVPCESHLVPAPRYEHMHERFALTLDEQLTCGFHVHVAIGSDDEGVAVLDRIRPWLPVILALSANSPFWQGVDTGFASYRYQAWGRWPTSGAYDRLGTADGYRAVVEAILATEVSLDRGMIYFDARLSAHAPTVEIRIADVCLRPDDAATIAILVRALVEKAAADWRSGAEADDVSTAMLRLAAWRASRFGISDTLVHPVTRQPCPPAAAVAALFEHADAGFSSPAERHGVELGLGRILRRGSGCSDQRKALAKHGRLGDVVAAAVARTHTPGPMPPAEATPGTPSEGHGRAQGASLGS
jgi:carboxylate-amine ligase